MNNSRRKFLKQFGYLTAGSILLPNMMTCSSTESTDELFFDISLAEWSLHRRLFDEAMTNLEFPEVAKNEFGINAVEYVNQFFLDKAEDKSYLDELNSRCNDLGVEQLLIMIDGEGDLAVSSETDRTDAIENHYKWIEAANHLGCHSIRVNLFGDGTAEEMKTISVDSLGRLSEFAADYEVNVIVENHGGYSSDAEWLTEVIQQVDMDNCGTLPDFGNFCLRREGGARWDAECVEEYDRYKGTRQLMPYAKGVSAKSYAFDEEGNETTIDFEQMLTIVRNAGFDGYIGVEYEGSELSEAEGIMATKELLMKIGKQISGA